MSELNLICSGMALALMLAFAACTPKPVATPTTSFRPANAPIWSAAAFLPAKISGDWRQVAGYSTGDSHGCAPGHVSFRQNGARLEVDGLLCLNGQHVAARGPVTMTGPGRFTVPGMGEWWVIWVDSGYRTLAIATPSGGFGFVLDRGAIPGDRLNAAAEIFDFNGYSKARLRRF